MKTTVSGHRSPERGSFLAIGDRVRAFDIASGKNMYAAVTDIDGEQISITFANGQEAIMPQSMLRLANFDD